MLHVDTYPLQLPHIVPAVNFDGTNDYLLRGANLTGIADGKEGTFSAWLKFNGGDGVLQRLMGTGATGARFLVNRNGSNRYAFVGDAAGGTQILNLSSALTINVALGWHHVLAAWNLATGTAQLYINDASSVNGTPTTTNDNIDYTQAQWTVGAISTGASPVNADVADLWFTNVYLDISVAANRRKFITSALKPADLDWDGSRPTGTAPLLFLSNHVDGWHINQGSGGGFTENGALTAAASSPSD